MGAFISRIFAQFAIVGCCMSLNVLLVSFATFIRNLPALADFLRRSLRWGLLLSYRVYNTILSTIQRVIGINLLADLPRILMSLVISLLPGVGLHLLLGAELRICTLAPFALHGLLVGYLWDELVEPGGIRLGERL
jgi:hypothetical protein